MKGLYFKPKMYFIFFSFTESLVLEQLKGEGECIYKLFFFLPIQGTKFGEFKIYPEKKLFKTGLATSPKISLFVLQFSADIPFNSPQVANHKVEICLCN